MSVRFAIALWLATAGVAVAAENPALARQARPEGLITMASASEIFEFPGTPNTLSAAVGRGNRITSAGVADSLPDEPSTDIPYTDLPYPLLLFKSQQPSRLEVPQSRGTHIDAPALGAPGLSLLDASPLAPVAHRLRSYNFNTEDGSMLSDFAICYRLSRRSSVEVIPGDPAPVKLPVVTVQGNMGVRVGMVIRLNKRG